MAVRIEMVPEVQEIFGKLVLKALRSRSEGILVKGVYKRFDILVNYPEYGDHVSRGLIPIEYIQKYAATNLYRIELPGYWRMLYTLRIDSVSNEVVIHILDLIDHETYNKKFGYRRN